MTRMQHSFLVAVSEHIARHGFSPSYHELATALGRVSIGNISRIANNLKRMGYIDFTPSRARSIRVLHMPGDDSPKALLVAEMARLGLPIAGCHTFGDLVRKLGGQIEDMQQRLRRMPEFERGRVA